ncbi:NAD(P)-dependent alcohol dehydrogenase [Rhizobium sp. BK376]|uniref:zinc-dependent alcohol dehydrogenase family protein n=1 Tax=Rhizobium sp. BK376 TaxID=2512149 RepID=UPI00104EC4A7|nr:NAD(P)-dependent alcohol dehydrogenase [Rhizobium sp. BK376]TCR67897.1 NADPH:quinone reductase-like Zn-dependent oxidoreductase [Rhizobium sp. BK376]
MQSYVLDSFGSGTTGLLLAERPEPTPKPNEVVLRVRARSLNFRDLRILEGLYPVHANRGVAALSDGAGEVMAVGSAVTRVSIGDRIVVAYFPRWVDGRFSLSMAGEQFGCTRDGMLAPLVAVPEAAAVRIPDNLSFEEAATLPCAGVTAWAALHGPRPLAAGESVLTLGTGGVALATLKFAKALGATVIAATSSAAKAERLRALGADVVVDYRDRSDWSQAVRQATGGRGVDHVVETGALGTLMQSVAALATEGELALVAALDPGQIEARTLFANATSLRRIYVGSRAHLEAAVQLVGSAGIRPVIDRVFGFSEARDAYSYAEKRQQFGKIVIVGD